MCAFVFSGSLVFMLIGPVFLLVLFYFFFILDDNLLNTCFNRQDCILYTGDGDTVLILVTQ